LEKVGGESVEEFYKMFGKDFKEAHGTFTFKSAI
jgi:hypothetical protein